MKTLILSLLLAFQSDGAQEEASLMQGVLRQKQLGSDTAQVVRKDTTARLMETATRMLKNGATPDVVQFIETTITEINQNVLGAITEEHNLDQGDINAVIGNIQAEVATMEACKVTVNQQHNDRLATSSRHKECRKDEALACAHSRFCESELEHLWGIVKTKEAAIRELHGSIHASWCVAEGEERHPDTTNPFQWEPTARKEGPETSETSDEYPSVDIGANIGDFRSASVTWFLDYKVKKQQVEEAWNEYNSKLLECAGLETALENKVTECDAEQTTLHGEACAHASSRRDCVTTFGDNYQNLVSDYEGHVDRIEGRETDRKREWETLHIVSCMLETVYTHVIDSIDSGEPCPTMETHPQQTEQEINHCHLIEESLTRNLTIDYGTVPEPPELPPFVAPPCTAEYIWEEHGAFPVELQNSFNSAIVADGLQNFVRMSEAGWAGCAAPQVCEPCEGSEDALPSVEYVEGAQACKAHESYLSPGQLNSETFRCLTGDQCIHASGRCNEHNNCDDGSDEQGCETNWGSPAVLQDEECREDFSSDVQFQCHSGGRCAPIEGRCNGVDNCADGSDEEGCGSGTTGLQLEATSGFMQDPHHEPTVEVTALQARVFHDREYTFDSIGSFTGKSFIKMSNEDKHTPHSHVQMKLRLPQPLTVYIATVGAEDEGDGRENRDHALPWLLSQGWGRTGLEGVEYHGVHETRHKDWDPSPVMETHNYQGDVYAKTFPAGVVELPGNNGGDGSYVVFVANPANAPTPPRDASWERHMQGEGRVKCNNNINVILVANRAACEERAEENGHAFYSFRANSVRGGLHKCMSSADCNNPMRNRSNRWRIYSLTAEA